MGAPLSRRLSIGLCGASCVAIGSMLSAGSIGCSGGGSSTSTPDAGFRFDASTPGPGFDPAVVARRAIEAECGFLQRCAPGALEARKLTRETCASTQVDRLKEFFTPRAQAALAGRILYQPDKLDECERLYATVDCNLGILDDDACGRFIVGTQPVNAPCLFDEECTPATFCRRAGGAGTCGTCAPRAPPGGDCRATECVENSACFAGDATAPATCARTNAALNAPCGTAQTGDCRGALSCVGPATGSVCKEPPALNAACDPRLLTAPDCNNAANLGCDQGVCKALTWSGATGPCNNTTQLCNIDGICPAAGGTCAAMPRVGMPCATRSNIVGEVCAAGAYCGGGTCATKKATGGSCISSVECQEPLSCLSGTPRTCGKVSWMLCNG